MGERYEMQFLEIGTDDDDVHFLIQGVPTIAIDKVVNHKKYNSTNGISKASTIKEGFMGRQFLDKWILCKYSWSIWKHGSIKRYVENQGKDYKQVHTEQLKLW